MASPFQRYTGGIEASTGNLVPAYGQMAEQTIKTLSGFGENIAEGIKTYNENTAKGEILTQEAEELSQQILQFKNQFGDSPEHAPFAQSLQPYIEKLSKVPAMSLSQKMGAVTGVKAAFANIGNQLQAFELVRGERLKRDMEAARLGVGEGTVVTKPVDILAGKVGIKSDKTIKQNIDDYVSVLDQIAGREGIKVDKNTAVANFKANIKQQIDKGVDLQGKPIDPALLGKLKDQFANEEKSTKDIMSVISNPFGYLTGEDAEATAAVGRLGTLDKSANVQLSEEIQAKIDTLKAGDEKGKETQAAIEALEKQRKEVQAKIDAGDYVESGVVPAVAGETGNFLAKNLAFNQWNVRQRMRSYATGSDFTADDVRYVLKSKAGNAISMFGGNIVGAVQEAAALLGMETLTKKQKEIIRQVIEEKDRGYETSTSYGAGKAWEKSPQKQVDAINTQIEYLKGQLSKTDNAPAIEAEIKRLDALKTPTSIGTSEKIVVGSYEKKVPLTVEQKETEMARFFQKKYGYVPSGFREMFIKNTPEASFKTMETPYGSFFYDGSGWKQMASTSKQQTAKEIGMDAAYQFGGVDAEGRAVPMNFANSGIYLHGIFKGTPEALEKFRLDYYGLSNSERSITRLIEINNMVGESMPWNADLQGEAKALIPELKAALRIDIIGVGTVSNYEQELINDVVADPTKFFSLESSDRAKLMVIADRIRNKISNYPTIYGLTVQRAADKAVIEKGLRQDLLTRNNKSRLEQEWEARSGGKTGTKIDWDLIKGK